MKLTRTALTHAQDQQLAVLGVTRQRNPGWLRRTLAAEFDAGTVEAFLQARVTRPQKGKRPGSVKADDDWLSELKGECQSEIYGGNLAFGEVGAGDFARWMRIAAARQNEDEMPLGDFDLLSVMRLFEEWVKATDLLPLVLLPDPRKTAPEPFANDL